MDREVGGRLTADYLWEVKGIVPFLKVDQVLAEEGRGVRLMKPIPHLDGLLSRAIKRHIFGTKMRSVIKAADPVGIRDIVKQQFELGLRIAGADLVPILEPEVDIHIPDKGDAEAILLSELKAHLAVLPPDVKLMFKLSIPTADGLYAPLMSDPHVIRVVALSGGYSRIEADQRLSHNHGLIASFSRALTEGLSARQPDEAFYATLAVSIREIYAASIT